MLFSALFVIQGLLIMPYPGLQTDEALFGSAIYEPRNPEGSLPAFKRQIPLMVMSYLGALKALLYWLLFWFWPPSIAWVRVPVILAGAISVWLFSRLLLGTLGRRAAVIGGLLLATDTTFLLTTTFDWGPVALQHLLLLAGLVLLIRFYRSRRPGTLAAAFFVFGLGMWDKAIFVWMLSGLTLAALVVFRRELLQAFKLRHLAVAAAALIVGAAPLIIYNLHYRAPTLTNARYDATDLPGKAWQLKISLEGSSLFGYLTREDDGHSRTEPLTFTERLSVALSDTAGRPRTNWLIPALAASVLFLPAWWRSPARRAILLALITMVVAWTQMALTMGTGGSTHHAVLLWPLPHLIVAAAFSQVSHRFRAAGLWLLAAAMALITGRNLLVSNEHLAQFVRHGPGPMWSEAVQPLTERLRQAKAPLVVVTDWGLLDSLRLLARGRLPLYQAIDLASKESLEQDDESILAWLLASPDNLYVGHTRENEAIVGSSDRLARHAARRGYRKHILATITDRHSRPVFEIYRLLPISAPGPPSSR